MAERLNKVYAEGLTRFETRGRSTSALQSPNVDNLLNKYSIRKDYERPEISSKRHDIQRLAAGLGRFEQQNTEISGRVAEINPKITRTQKQIMSRSTDKFLGRGNNPYQQRKYGLVDYNNEYQPRGRVDSYNLPVAEHKRESDIYQRLAKYDVGGRFGKVDRSVSDIYNKYSEPTMLGSKNLDYARKELEIKGFQNDFGVRDKQYPSDLPLSKNPRGFDRYNMSMESQYNPKSLLKQLQDQPKKDAFVGRQFGKELNRDYTKQMSRGISDIALDKQHFMKDYLRGGPTKPYNKDYLKDYSPILGKQTGLGKMKVGDTGKAIGTKDYDRGIDLGKYDKYDNLRSTAYRQNIPDLGKKHDPLTVYRGSLRGDY